MLIFIFQTGKAQVRLSKLELKPHEKFTFAQTDILVVDTLIMHDSSSLFLNMDKAENYIHAKKMIVAKGCSINGYAKNGKQGKTGEEGFSQQAPCRSGLPGKTGFAGEPGMNAVTLSLYLNDLRIYGSLTINLNGGDGGKGGRGGKGGDGGAGTRVCRAGNGADGGDGADGGSGGKGGTLNISCKGCNDIHLMMDHQLIVKNYGGFGGLGGDGGLGGQAGLGPVVDGKNGKKGREGAHAPDGKVGTINIIHN